MQIDPSLWYLDFRSVRSAPKAPKILSVLLKKPPPFKMAKFGDKGGFLRDIDWYGTYICDQMSGFWLETDCW